MGEEKTPFFEPSFNRAVKVRSREERLTSDAGVILVREADHRLGLIASLAGQLEDPRDPSKIRYTLTELLRERLFALSESHAIIEFKRRSSRCNRGYTASSDRGGHHHSKHPALRPTILYSVGGRNRRRLRPRVAPISTHIYTLSINNIDSIFVKRINRKCVAS